MPVDQPGIEVGPFSDLLARTDSFVFEFSLATQRDGEYRLERERITLGPARPA